MKRNNFIFQRFRSTATPAMIQKEIVLFFETLFQCKCNVTAHNMHDMVFNVLLPQHCDLTFISEGQETGAIARKHP
jgi:hypothetical protein